MREWGGHTNDAMPEAYWQVCCRGARPELRAADAYCWQILTSSEARPCADVLLITMCSLLTCGVCQAYLDIWCQTPGQWSSVNMSLLATILFMPAMCYDRLLFLFWFPADKKTVVTYDLSSGLKQRAGVLTVIHSEGLCAPPFFADVTRERARERI